PPSPLARLPAPPVQTTSPPTRTPQRNARLTVPHPLSIEGHGGDKLAGRHDLAIHALQRIFLLCLFNPPAPGSGRACCRRGLQTSRPCRRAKLQVLHDR